MNVAALRAIAMIMGGCITNNFVLELIIKFALLSFALALPSKASIYIYLFNFS
jgi:hypothetical protein